uniref:C-type lectin domain-containing protein n=1 Tax=Elaeophora elaphi TaxID=1147741 RepID=A0A0R3S0J5_9BILA
MTIEGLSSTFPSSSVTAITSEERLSPSSSTLKASTEYKKEVFSPLINEINSEGEATNEFVPNGTVENHNKSESKEEISTISSSESNIPDVSTMINSPTEIVSEIGSSSSDHSKRVPIGSLYPSDSSNESSVTVLQSTTAVSSRPQYWCEDGWRFFRGRCYIQMTESSYSYYEAIKNCKDIGSVLVTIANVDVIEFLYCKDFHLCHNFKSDHYSEYNWYS